MSKRYLSGAAIVPLMVLLTSASALLAEGCKGFPIDGIDPDLIAANKFVAAASATVSFDDVDSVKDATEEATLDAKGMLSKFFTETIQTDDGLEKVIKESKAMSGAGKQNVRNETITRTKSLRNRSQALLRGVVVLGSCYTKGTEVRVT